MTREVEVDPLSLTVAALLARKAAGGFADSAGKSLWNRLDGLQQKVVARFHGEPTGEDALAALACSPDDAARVRVVAELIDEHIRAHGPFRSALADELAGLSEEPEFAAFITTISGEAKWSAP